MPLEEIHGGLATAKTKEDGSITAAFERLGKGKHTYSAQPHTYAETCIECVKWVAKYL
ncbi:hypothetical protein AX14_008424 [Amanita brunnescens Koide BX004]|nr:hypothetical protein AX14_008424 [Amanita brunnescens Koide BX004]